MQDEINKDDELVQAEETVHDAYMEGVVDADEVGQLDSPLAVQEKAATVASEVVDYTPSDTAEEVRQPAPTPVAAEETAPVQEAPQAPAEVAQEIQTEQKEATQETQSPLAQELRTQMK